ncbi:hypothetical protein [Castellaniella caeni]|nr:hypothetical protein [Castellaniella caeni]
MYYIVDSKKPFDQAATDLDAAVKRHHSVYTEVGATRIGMINEAA